MFLITYLLRRRQSPSVMRQLSRPYSTPGTERPQSPHSQWYANIVPAMVPVFLLGSAVYLGLQLAQLKLSHEKYMEEAAERVRALEAEVDALQANKNRESSVPESALLQSNAKKSRWW